MSAEPVASTLPPPALYDHCVTVYDAMLQRAYRTTPANDEPPQVIYEGKLTQLIRELHLPVPYYTFTLTELKRMGCVKQLRRGGGTAPSQWELITEPTTDLWNGNGGHSTTYTSSKQREMAMVNQQIRNLTSRVNELVNAHNLLVEQVTALQRGRQR
jgi:hypothetical protein